MRTLLRPTSQDSSISEKNCEIGNKDEILSITIMNYPNSFALGS